MNRKKLYRSVLTMGLASLLFFGGFVTTPLSAFATTNDNGVVTNYSSKSIDKQIINEKLDNIQEGLIDYLESLDDINDSDPIDLRPYFDNLSDKDKLSDDELNFIILEGNKINTNARDLKLSSIERERVQTIKTVETKNNLKIDFYNNGIFSIERKDRISPKNLLKARSSDNVWGQAYKDYYSQFGNRTFTVAVGCGFTFDGEKAGYYGNFKAYYKKGVLCVWSVSDWDKGHESVRNKYMAYCEGNFDFGIDIHGTKCSIQNMFIRHEVVCDPYGECLSSFNVD